MARTKPIALRCKISQGGFSGEKIVHINTAEGKETLALAPTDYCWKANGEPWGKNEPAELEDGLVAAIKYGKNGDHVVVSTPDGSIFTVFLDIVTERPEQEPVTHVSV